MIGNNSLLSVATISSTLKSTCNSMIMTTLVGFESQHLLIVQWPR